LLGFGLAGTFSTLLSYQNTPVTVGTITLGFAIFATISFIISIFVMKNEPKKRMEKKVHVNFKVHMKILF
jgi:hypothetical protein